MAKESGPPVRFIDWGGNPWQGDTMTECIRSEVIDKGERDLRWTVALMGISTCRLAKHGQEAWLRHDECSRNRMGYHKKQNSLEGEADRWRKVGEKIEYREKERRRRKNQKNHASSALEGEVTIGAPMLSNPRDISNAPAAAFASSPAAESMPASFFKRS